MKKTLNRNKGIVGIGVGVILFSLLIPNSAYAEQKVSKRIIELKIEASHNDAREYGELPVSADRSYIVREEKVTITAYNSVPEQTDSTPCIGAQGTDICKIYATGENVCAANFVPLGTKIDVDGLGTCIVRDRMNARYHKRIDWYMGMDISSARKFGVRTKQVAIYSK